MARLLRPPEIPRPEPCRNVLMSGLHAVVLLASARGVAKAGDHFVQNQQRTVFLREFAKPLEISIARQDAAHVRHDWLGDHGREFVTVPLQKRFESSDVVPRRQHHIVESRGWNAFRVRDVGWILHAGPTAPAHGCAHSEDRDRTSRGSDLRI